MMWKLENLASSDLKQSRVLDDKIKLFNSRVESEHKFERQESFKYQLNHVA